MGCLLGCRVSGDLEIRYNAGYQSTDHHILDWTFAVLGETRTWSNSFVCLISF